MWPRCLPGKSDFHKLFKMQATVLILIAIMILSRLIVGRGQRAAAQTRASRPTAQQEGLCMLFPVPSAYRRRHAVHTSLFVGVVCCCGRVGM